MTAEVVVPVRQESRKREKTPLEKLMGDFSRPGVVDEIDALAGMDPVSVGILTGRVVSSAVLPGNSPEPLRRLSTLRILIPCELTRLSFQLSFDF